MSQDSINTINLRLDNRVSCLDNVSKTRELALNKMGIYTVRDLLYHFPRRYIDLSHVSNIAGARSGKSWMIGGTIHAIEEKQPKPGVDLIEMTIVDETGTLIVTFFRQKFILDVYKVDDRVVVGGDLVFNFGFKRMTNPFIAKLPQDKSTYDMAKIIPVHGASTGVSAGWMRNIISNALNYTKGLSSFVPKDIIKKYKLLELWDALCMIHFPTKIDDISLAKRTLKYCEVLLLQLEIMSKSNNLVNRCIPVTIKFNGDNLLSVQKSIPFQLTDDQQVAFSEIATLLGSNKHCNHLLLGDVGTGKTVIVALSIAACIDSGYQAAVMVPTTILANQHFLTFKSFFKSTDIKCEILTSATKEKDRHEIITHLKSGDIDVIIGTQSLLNQEIEFNKPGLMVVDEQHRFGVEQRDKFISKGIWDDNENKTKYVADLISMSATPIPRSLSLMLYGDKTCSLMTQHPHQYKFNNEISNDCVDGPKTTTKVFSRKNMNKAYDCAFDALDRGEQVFIVCPLVGVSHEERNNRSYRFNHDSNITPSNEEKKYIYRSVVIDDESDYYSDNPKAAIQHCDILQNQVFTTYNVDVIHGSMSSEEKNKIMENFVNKKIDVLVSTSVIEVGIDVKNATVMIIEDADRFGLAQLHQLRGRVGRSNKNSHVFLICNSNSEIAIKRLSSLENCNEGAKLAAIDLDMRGEGDILGNKQHGTKTLKLISVMKDQAIIKTANKDACKILSNDPKLQNIDNILLRYEISHTFKRSETLH